MFKVSCEDYITFHMFTGHRTTSNRNR